MIHDSSFERVRDEVSKNLEPVTPLRPAWMSALVVIPVALFLLSLVLVVYGLRSDATTIGGWALWGPASLMVGAAYAVLMLALVQRAPESTVSRVWWVALPLLAIGTQLGGTYWTLAHSGPPAAVSWQTEAMCFVRISALGMPPVILVLWLLSRGLPLRPKVASLLAGIGGGLVSEGVYRLHCGMSQPAHIVPWHTGAILVMGLFGLIAGMWWERRQLPSWQEQSGH
ncbi:MAG: hypothetical protein BMS9Abin37_3108 [Acidobacteriota bacterium]|nr:MAG: hypothetical protein BMS9Abin37_3108 [Acidobacteriota bacterium]